MQVKTLWAPGHVPGSPIQWSIHALHSYIKYLCTYVEYFLQLCTIMSILFCPPIFTLLYLCLLILIDFALALFSYCQHVFSHISYPPPCNALLRLCPFHMFLWDWAWHPVAITRPQCFASQTFCTSTYTNIYLKESLDKSCSRGTLLFSKWCVCFWTF